MSDSNTMNPAPVEGEMPFPAPLEPRHYPPGILPKYMLTEPHALELMVDAVKGLEPPEAVAPAIANVDEERLAREAAGSAPADPPA